MTSKLKILSFLLFNSIFAIHASHRIENKYLTCTQLPAAIHPIIANYVFDEDNIKQLIKDGNINALQETLDFLRNLDTKQKAKLSFLGRLEFLNIELCPNITGTLKKIYNYIPNRIASFYSLVFHYGEFLCNNLTAPIECPVRLYFNRTDMCSSNNSYTEKYLEQQMFWISIFKPIFLLLLGYGINKFIDIKSIGNFLKNCPNNLKNYFSRKRIYNFCSSLQ